MGDLPRRLGPQGNMIIAVGSLLHLHPRAGSFRSGAILLHAVSAVVFAALYYGAMLQLGLAAWPKSIAVGIGFGVLHGLVVSLALVWVVAEQHPPARISGSGARRGREPLRRPHRLRRRGRPRHRPGVEVQGGTARPVPRPSLARRARRSRSYSYSIPKTALA